MPTDAAHLIYTVNGFSPHKHLIYVLPHVIGKTRFVFYTSSKETKSLVGDFAEESSD